MLRVARSPGLVGARVAIRQLSLTISPMKSSPAAGEAPRRYSSNSRSCGGTDIASVSSAGGGYGVDISGAIQRIGGMNQVNALLEI